MMRLAGISAFFILAAGCGVGDDGPGPNPNPNPNGRVCGAVLATSGSFTPDAANPPPTDYEGCWPVGMWTFTVAVSMNDCSAAPTPLAQYQMKGIVMPDQNGDPLPEMTYVTAPGPRVIASHLREARQRHQRAISVSVVRHTSGRCASVDARDSMTSGILPRRRSGWP